MDADIINPFIQSTLNVITTVSSVEVTVGRPSVKTDRRTWGEVTGLIGLAGYQASGNMILSFDRESILHIVSKMLMEEFTEIDEQISDAVGELTNMISGGAKTAFNGLGFFFEMAIPVVLLGKDIEVKELTNSPIITVPFTTEKGQFVLEASLSMGK